MALFKTLNVGIIQLFVSATRSSLRFFLPVICIIHVLDTKWALVEEKSEPVITRKLHNLPKLGDIFFCPNNTCLYIVMVLS